MDTHYAIIGTAHVADGFPLYYDAVNEKGLGMAGLNFVGSAQYAEVVPDRENIAQFEFIPTAARPLRDARGGPRAPCAR